MVFTLLFLASIICSILSQLPPVLDSGLDAYLKLIWIAPLCVGFVKERNHLFDFELRPFYLFAAIFMIYCIIMESFIWSPNGYFGPDCYNIAVSFMVMIVSYLYWNQIDESNRDSILKLLSISILICTVILSLTVYFGFLYGVDLSGRIYAFKEKNSMGQMLLVGSFIGIYLTWPQKRILRIIYIFIAIIILFIILALKSRATIISMVSVILYFLFFHDDKRIKKYLMIFLSILLMYLFIISDYGGYVIDNFILAGRDANNMDDMSSGRFTIIERKLGWIQNDWIGVGNTYLDCFPIAIYVQYGIIGCLIMGCFFLFLWCKVFSLYNGLKINMLTKVLFISFITNCLFEAYPPFGPGIKCFMLWMFLGFSLSYRNKYLEYNYVN